MRFQHVIMLLTVLEVVLFPVCYLTLKSAMLCCGTLCGLDLCAALLIESVTELGCFVVVEIMVANSVKHW